MNTTTNTFRQTIISSSKKIAITMAMLLTLGISYGFAKPVDSVDGEIKASFNKSFQNARIISTESRRGFTKLTFKMNDIVMTAFYSNNGELLAVTRNITSDLLPISLLMDLKSNYSGYWITELFELTGDGESCYYVSLENGDTKLTLRSGSDSWEVYSNKKK